MFFCEHSQANFLLVSFGLYIDQNRVILEELRIVYSQLNNGASEYPIRKFCLSYSRAMQYTSSNLLTKCPFIVLSVEKDVNDKFKFH